ncbi:MAG TPA: DVUA0089 family protein [Chthonomonadaceae bacterium]|nr:DVUA0089 family protein [Chthonomonadaceae bacterium]
MARATRFAIACALLLSPLAAFAAPHVSYIFPPGGQRGSTVKVTLSGTDLASLTGFYSTGAGVTAKADPGGSATERTYDVTVAKDAPLGIQQIRFYGKAGLTNARYFDVGQWPEREQTPGSGTPLSVMPPVTVNSRIASTSTRNGVTFPGRAGESLVCEIQGLRILGQIGDSWLKGYLEITDSAGNVLASSDGTPDEYYRWDPVITFTPPKDGEYAAWFRDLNWRGAPMADYRLTIAAMPHAYGIFPLGGRRGTSPTVHFLGANLSHADRPVPVPSDPSDPADRIQVAITTAAGTTNERPFQVSDLADATQKAGNSSLNAAQAVQFPCVVNGRIERDGLRDYYKFTLDKRQRVAIEVWSRRLGTPMDPDVTLYDAAGNAIGDDDDSRGRDSRIERDIAPGTYTVRVRDIDDRGGIAYPYRLFIAPPEPRFSLVCTPDAPALTAGGTVTLAVKVERTDGFDGPVEISVPGLPAGVTAAPLIIAKGQQEGKLTVTAAATAALGPIRLHVRGTGKAGDRELLAEARTSETYNIQGTAYQRDLIGPIVLVSEK